MAKKTYGKTASGKPITDELVDGLADKAEAGYDVDETLRRRGGRPLIGSAAASVESVRLDPELRQALAASRTRPRDHLIGDPQGAAQVPPSRLTTDQLAPPFARPPDERSRIRGKGALVDRSRPSTRGSFFHSNSLI
jgi:hypothetical protein